MKTVGLILAAGASSRMGRSKAMLIFNGHTYLNSVASRLVDAGCEHVYIVAGAHPLEIPSELSLHCSLIRNVGWRAGMRSSILSGLTSIEAQSVCIQPVDTPGVLVQTIQRLIAVEPTYAAVPTYKGQSGHPVIAGKALQSRLLQPDSASLRDVLKTVKVTGIEVQDVAILNNINTPQSHRAFVEQSRT